ncbi:MAG TPA: LysR family transcriptional regulator [Baekduia sp.]|nr:LysR family transcriptional regulator [Baekduia sp.]
MELRQLEYFAAVARHRHFTRAAEELYVTQPALSQQVRRLEAELGVALLVRGSRGVELTPAGADLLQRAEAILAEAARARAEMDAHAGAQRGLVRVAATAADAPALPEALVGFHRAHPGIRIALRHGSAREVADLVGTGAAELAVAALGQGAVRELDHEVVRDEPLVLALPPGDPLAGTGAVALWDVRERPFLLAERGTALRDSVVAACEEAGFGPVPPFEVSDPAAVRAIVGAGLGVGVVPGSWLRGAGPQVAVAALREPVPRHRVALVAAAGLAPAAALLRAWLRDALS